MAFIILCNLNKTGALFKTNVLCLYQVTFFLHEMSLKRRILFQKGMLEKSCEVIKSYWWHMEEII